MCHWIAALNTIANEQQNTHKRNTFCTLVFYVANVQSITMFVE